MRDFNHTVNVLVNAYLKGTLEHSKCSACAVGNIIGDSLGTSPRKLEDDFGYAYAEFENGDRVYWQHVFMTAYGTQDTVKCNYRGVARDQIDATGYTWEELAKIEYAFETAPGECHPDTLNDKWMFNGLMAVVDVLASIHNIDLTAKEEAKKLFVKAV